MHARCPVPCVRASHSFGSCIFDREIVRETRPCVAIERVEVGARVLVDSGSRRVRRLVLESCGSVLDVALDVLEGLLRGPARGVACLLASLEENAFLLEQNLLFLLMSGRIAGGGCSLWRRRAMASTALVIRAAFSELSSAFHQIVVPRCA